MYKIKQNGKHKGNQYCKTLLCLSIDQLGIFYFENMLIICIIILIIY